MCFLYTYSVFHSFFSKWFKFLKVIIPNRSSWNNRNHILGHSFHTYLTYGTVLKSICWGGSSLVQFVTEQSTQTCTMLVLFTERYSSTEFHDLLTVRSRLSYFWLICNLQSGSIAHLRGKQNRCSDFSAAQSWRLSKVTNLNSPEGKKIIIG